MMKVRSGTSRMQLQDHVVELQKHLSEKETQVQDLKQCLEREYRETESVWECCGPTPSNQSTRSGEATPTTLSTPCFTPSSRKARPSITTMQQESKALRTEKLIQAA